MMNSISRILVLGVCTLGICFTAGCEITGGGNNKGSALEKSALAAEKTEYEKAIVDIEDLTKDQRCALEATHYCLEIAALLKEDIYPDGKLDRFTLEQQYRRIVDEDYKFSNLRKETVDLLIDVVERIKDLRIEAGDRELLNELYDQEKTWALFRCLPANMAVLVSADWKQLVANTVQTLLFTVVNYIKIRKEIELTHRKESWELDKKELENETKYFQRKIKTLFGICESYKVEPVKENGMTELIRRFNGVNAETDEDRMKKLVNDHRIWLRDRVRAERYKFCSTYWFHRGYLACKIYWKYHDKIDLQEARGCFDVYQKLTEHTIIERNPVAIEVAQKQIYLLLEETKGNDIDQKIRKKIFDHLAIIRENLSDKSLDRQSVYIFCGQIYFCALQDYDNAAKMFKNAEESAINRKRQKAADTFCRCIEKGDRVYEFKGTNSREEEEWSKVWKKCHESRTYPIGKFAAEDDDDHLHFLPKVDVEFYARMARYESLIRAGKDVGEGYSLVDEISRNEANWPYISPLEFLFYAAYVKEAMTKKKYYEIILPRVLLSRKKEYDCGDYYAKFPNWKVEPVAKNPLPYELKFLRYDSNYWPRADRYLLKVPYQYALLDIKVSMNLMRGGSVIYKVPCEDTTCIEKDKNGQMFLCLFFPINQSELIKRNTDCIRFDFEYRYFKASISFDLNGQLKEKKNEEFYENLPGHISLEMGEVPRTLENREPRK